MTAQKYTAGEWVIETETKGFEICTVHGVERQPTEDGLGQSWVYVRPASLFRDGKWHWPDEAEQMANARLVAAAPNMLEALYEAEEYFDNRADADHDETGFVPNEEMKLLTAVRAAIAKAEGRS